MIKDEFGNRRFYGFYRGIVFDNNDPLGKRRLRIQVPQVLFDAVTDWAWEVENTGQNLPSIKDGVWVTFEGGDPSYPIWTGTFGKAPESSFSGSSVLIDGGSA
jgi:hypothetical protein